LTTTVPPVPIGGTWLWGDAFMLTVYGRATSSNTQLVMWAIGEL
jgi:hypothetical protein